MLPIRGAYGRDGVIMLESSFGLPREPCGGTCGTRSPRSPPAPVYGTKLASGLVGGLLALSVSIGTPWLWWLRYTLLASRSAEERTGVGPNGCAPRGVGCTCAGGGARGVGVSRARVRGRLNAFSSSASRRGSGGSAAGAARRLLRLPVSASERLVSSPSTALGAECDARKLRGSAPLSEREAPGT